MSRIEKPTLKLKFELEIPVEEGPTKKFSVSRTLKAKWCDDPEKVTNDVMKEITDYKGSFMGDLLASLGRIHSNEERPTDLGKSQRDSDVAKWLSSIIESILISSFDDKEFVQQFVENDYIQEWDGSIKNIDKVTQREAKETNIDKVMILLQPKIKHVSYLVSKLLK